MTTDDTAQTKHKLPTGTIEVNPSVSMADARALVRKTFASDEEFVVLVRVRSRRGGMRSYSRSQLTRVLNEKITSGPYYKYAVETIQEHFMVQVLPHGQEYKANGAEVEALAGDDQHVERHNG